ncbi:MAG: hypothetical protein ACOY3P_24210, partial [Planctomycetota bacterium]
ASEPSGTPEQHLARKRACAQRGIQMGCNAVTHLSLAAQLTGWNTPRSTDGSNGGPNQTGGALPADVALTGWPTPQARNPDAGNSDYDRRVEAAMGLRASKNAPKLTGWATASARDWRDGRASQETMDRNSRPLNEQVVMLGPTSQSSTAATARPAASVLNPAMSRWLQAFPAAWDRSSPGWQEWRRLQDAIASGGCEGMETP